MCVRSITCPDASNTLEQIVKSSIRALLGQGQVIAYTRTHTYAHTHTPARLYDVLAHRLRDLGLTGQVHAQAHRNRHTDTDTYAHSNKYKHTNTHTRKCTRAHICRRTHAPANPYDALAHNLRAFCRPSRARRSTCVRSVDFDLGCGSVVYTYAEIIHSTRTILYLQDVTRDVRSAGLLLCCGLVMIVSPHMQCACAGVIVCLLNGNSRAPYL